MKKLALISTLILIVFGADVYAQESRIGLKGGVNLSTLSIDDNNDKNLKMGFHAGVFNKIGITDKFAIQPELLYSVKGVKYNFDDNVLADGNAKFNLNYLDLPVKLVFNLSEDFEFQFGPYVSYLLNAILDTYAEVLGFWDIDGNDELDRENYNAFDFGVALGLGFDFDPLVVGFNYNLGLTPVAKEDKVSRDILDEAKNSVIQVYVGIKF
jgi:hypothetical protein